MSKKVESLTEDQIAAMPVFAKEWVDRLDKGAKLDIEAATKGAKWLYSFCKLKDPLTIFVSSPLGLQFAANFLKKIPAQVRAQVWDQVRDQVGDQVGNQVRDQVEDQVRDQVEDQVREQVWDQVRDQVWAQVGAQVMAQVRAQLRAQVGDQVGDQVWDQVWNQVRDQVGEQVGDQVRDQVGDQVRAQVESQVREQKISYEYQCSYGSFAQDAAWVAFYEFFKEQKICAVDLPQFEAFASLIKANIFESVQLEGAYIGCEMPTKIHRDSEGRLHSTGGMAIQWSDGWGFHAIHGVRMSPELHKSITERTITSAQVLALENIEQRMVALKTLGAEFVIGALPHKLVDTGKNGNELLEVMIEDEKSYCLKYRCPSTDRIYVSFVDPEVGEKLDADLSMGWKFGITKEMYQSMSLES